MSNNLNKLVFRRGLWKFIHVDNDFGAETDGHTKVDNFRDPDSRARWHRHQRSPQGEDPLPRQETVWFRPKHNFL